MKTTKKLFTMIAIAAFFLTIAGQTDAFALSIRSIGRAIDNAVFQPIKNDVIRPIADIVHPDTNPITTWLKDKIRDQVLGPAWDAIVRGGKEALNLATLAVTDWEAFRQQLRMWGDRAGVYDYSDHDFIRHVTTNAKVREALLLLRERTPDVFNWIKRNLAGIRTKKDVGKVYDTDVDASGRFEFYRGRIILLDIDSVEDRSIAQVAALIAHETAHVVNYFSGSLITNIDRGLNHWKEEYAADQVEANIADRLGIGAGTFKLNRPYDRTINGLGVIRVTEETRNWQPGIPSTHGYWHLATTALRGWRSTTQTSAKAMIEYKYSNPTSADGHRPGQAYTTTYNTTITSEFVEVINPDGPNPEVRILDTKAEERETVETTEILATTPDGRPTDVMVTTNTSNSDGTSTHIKNTVDLHYDNSLEGDAPIPSGGVAKNPPAYDNTPTEKNTDTSNIQVSEAQIIYDASGNTTIVYTDASGRTIAEERKTDAKTTVSTGKQEILEKETVMDDAGNPFQITRGNVKYNDQGKVTGYTEEISSIANGKAVVTTSEYRNITYPPIAGPQGAIAPDVVNPNAGQTKAAVAAGGK